MVNLPVTQTTTTPTVGSKMLPLIHLLELGLPDSSTYHGNHCQHCQTQMNLLRDDFDKPISTTLTYKGIEFMIKWNLNWCGYLKITPDQANIIESSVYGGFTYGGGVHGDAFGFDTGHFSDFRYHNYYIYSNELCTMNPTIFRNFDWVHTHIKGLIDRLIP